MAVDVLTDDIDNVFTGGSSLVDALRTVGNSELLSSETDTYNPYQMTVQVASKSSHVRSAFYGQPPTSTFTVSKMRLCFP